MAIATLQFKLNQLNLEFVDDEYSASKEDRLMLVASVAYPRAGKDLIEVIKTIPVNTLNEFKTHNQQIMFMDKVEMGENADIATDVKLFFVNNKTQVEQFFEGVFFAPFKLFFSGISSGIPILDKAVKGSIDGVIDSLTKAKQITEIANTTIKLRSVNHQDESLTVESQPETEAENIDSVEEDFYLSNDDLDTDFSETKPEVPYLSTAKLVYSMNVIE